MSVLKRIELIENVSNIDNQYIYDFQSNLILPNLKGFFPSYSPVLLENIFTIFLDYIIKHNNNDNICFINSNRINDYFVTIDLVNLTYIIPQIIEEKVKECSNKNNDIFILPIKIKINETDAHSNIIIIDHVHLQIELFEPHGILLLESPIHITNLIFNLVNKLFLGESLLYNFKNIQNTCIFGVQSKQTLVDSISGHCLAWSLLFIHVKILNINIPSENIIHFLHTLTPHELDIYIKKYISFLELLSINFTNKNYDNNIYTLSLTNTDILDIQNRIVFLINKYKKVMEETSDDDKNKEDEIKKIFNELISYKNVESFHKIFFKTFNSK